MADKMLLAHDLGTSANKAVLVTVSGEIVDQVKQEYSVNHPKPGWAEQDAWDWWDAVCQTSRAVLAKSGVKPEDVIGMTFTSQTQGFVPVDNRGNPLRPAISWLDGRSADIMREVLWKPPTIKGYNIWNLLRFLTITGGSPGHTGKDQIGKLLWLQKHEPEIVSAAYKFLDVKDFVIFQLTGRAVTSVDLAVIWWMLDTRKNRNQWHPALVKLAGIRMDQLAEVMESAAVAGKLTPEAAQKTGLLPGIPVINGAGDLASAALGSGAIDEGELHISLGTSGWVAGHFRKRKIDLPHYTGCIGSTNPAMYYLAMAHQETAGICLEWLRNKVLYHKEMLKEEMHVSQIYQVLDQLAEKAGPGAEGLLFTPWMYGERCPLDDEHVRGGLFNIGLNHSREHIVRAVFEGIALNTRWALETMEKLYRNVNEVRIVGGGANSEIWCQIIADVTNKNILRIADPQLSGAKGVALLGAMTLGYMQDFHEIKKFIKVDRTFTPDPKNRKLYDTLFKEFKAVYRQNKKWYARMNPKSA